MAHYHEFFNGKRVSVLGLGLLGRGIGDAAFIASHGGIVTVTDTKTEAELQESVAQLSGYDITFHFGGHIESDFTNTDMVIKGAGVRLDSPEIAAARQAGVPVYMSTALAAKFASEVGATVIGVTGTRGKSTVTHMIHHALVTAGKSAHLGGNIRGVSTLALLPEIKAEDFLVLELDSWQLQGFGDLEISPNVGVFTNLQTDHQNYYPDMDSYFNDKANIFRFQKKGDSLIATPELAEKIASFGAGEDAYRKHIETPTPVEWKLEMPGEHNRVNAALAAAALEVLGLTTDQIRSGLESFGGVEGRLQFIREVGGVKIYNDNNATTPQATIAALQALDSGSKNIVLLMGGADKGLLIDDLLAQIDASCKEVVLLAGTGSDRIFEKKSWYRYDDLEMAVQAALGRANEGDILLFSPAFASFGMFKNEYDRNDRFMGIIQSL
jgi:UDP-N-acetylmuramoylalanine--D-glutamate ligase